MRSKRTTQLVYFAFFTAIMVILTTTQLGFIYVGPIRATTLHIPVILAGILFGRKFGAGIGFVFGLLSLAINTFQPTLTSFVFSPFLTNGNLASLIVVFIPRIFLGFSSGLLWELVSKKTNQQTLPVAIIALISTLIHSLFVLSLIALLFGSTYASVKGFETSYLFTFIKGIITTNGIAEAGVASILVPALYKALNKNVQRSSL